MAVVASSFATVAAPARADEADGANANPANASATRTSTSVGWTGPAAEAKTRADRAMDRGSYAEALAAYREAYAAEPSPALLYNMGRAYEKLGRPADALNALESFSAAASPDLKSRVPRLDALMHDLRGRVTELSIHANVNGASIWVRGERVGATPLGRPYAVSPGVGRVEIRAAGYATVTRDLVLEEGRMLMLDVTLVPLSAATTTTTSAMSADDGATASTPITKRWWFWTGVGAVVVGGAAVTVAVLSSSHSAPQGDIEPRQVTAPLLRF